MFTPLSGLFAPIASRLASPLIKWGLIALAVAGLAGYHFYTKWSLEHELTAQKLATQERETQLTQARADLQTLTTAYNAQQAVIEDNKRNIDAITAELKATRSSDAATTARLKAVQVKLADTQRQAREKALREGPRAELLLSIYNKDIACKIANFARTGGDCVSGQWINN